MGVGHVCLWPIADVGSGAIEVGFRRKNRRCGSTTVNSRNERLWSTRRLQSTLFLEPMIVLIAHVVRLTANYTKLISRGQRVT
jgi:hypothetical protein